MFLLHVAAVIVDMHFTMHWARSEGIFEKGGPY